MLNNLRKIYPNILIFNLDNVHTLHSKQFSSYEWFIFEQNSIIGIPTIDLKHNDFELLCTFLTPYNVTLAPETQLEKMWYNLLFYNQNTQINKDYRFIFFQCQEHNNDQHDISFTFKELFQKEVPIIWLNQYEGILIEYLSVTEELLNFESVIDNLAIDLSINIKMFIGFFNNKDQSPIDYFNLVTEMGRIVLKETNKLALDYFQSIPYLSLRYIDLNTKKQIIQNTLKHFSRDNEMLHTLQTFLRNNMNISETAKQLFMHRNTLQYRIDKFVNETKIDIQQFDQAFVLQLALIANNIDE